MDRNRIGVCEFSLPCWGPIAISMAHKAGFEGMQLADCGGSRNSYPFMNQTIRDAYMRSAEENEITFQALHLHTLFQQRFIHKAPRSAEGKEARISLLNGAVSCRKMGIPTMMMTATSIMNREEYDYVTDAIRYAIEVCEENGVQLSMETDMTPAEIRELRDIVGPGLKICFDTMNPTIYGIGEPHALLTELGTEVIDHFHVKDCVRNANGYFTKYTTPMRLIGEGESGFAKCVKAINALDYTGWFISETFYFAPEFAGSDYLELATKDAATLKAAFCR